MKKRKKDGAGKSLKPAFERDKSRPIELRMIFPPLGENRVVVFTDNFPHVFIIYRASEKEGERKNDRRKDRKREQKGKREGRRKREGRGERVKERKRKKERKKKKEPLRQNPSFFSHHFYNEPASSPFQLSSSV